MSSGIRPGVRSWVAKRDMATAIALAIFGVVVFAALFPVLGRRRPGPATPSPSPDRSATPATG
jgi:peptidoglycan biosynthesis protein MviN/MurJ (putative lipid II flippase)